MIKIKIKIRVIHIVIIVIIVLAVSIIISNSKKSKNQEQDENFTIVSEDGTIINNSEKLKQDKEIDGMIMNKINIKSKNNETTLTANIQNITEETKGDYPVIIKIKDKDSKVIKQISGYINTVEPNETTVLRIKTSYDFANAYDFEIEKAGENATNE